MISCCVTRSNSTEHSKCYSFQFGVKPERKSRKGFSSQASKG
nr:MAG TPA: hypothetical protein [Caudoviricetes sp.]